MLTRPQFDRFTRKMSCRVGEEYLCRVEICIFDDFRILTDQCKKESNIPVVLGALEILLCVYVAENFPTAKVKDCRKLGKPEDKTVKVW